MMNARRFLAGLLAVCIMLSLVYIAPVQILADTTESGTTENAEPTTAPETEPEAQPQTEEEPQANEEGTVYYLFGHINDVDYGCQEDFETMGEYKFVDGTLVATFETDSYVAVKEQDNTNWYMFKEYCDDVTGTLYNTSTGAAEKMFVPANMVVTFTLEENEDGTLTLSYDAVCDHEYTEKTTVAATCTKTGLKTYTCSLCKHTYTKVVPALGHNNTCKVNVATCKSYASYDLTCTVCGFQETLYADKLMYEGRDQIPSGMDPTLFTTEPLYRYRNQKLATSLEPEMDGYELIGTEWVDGVHNSIYYVNSWPSGFDTTNPLYTKYNNKANKVTAYEEENTKLAIDSDKVVGYLYYHWCSTSDANHYSYASKTSTHNIFHAYYSEVSPDNFRVDVSDMSYKTSDECCADGNSEWFFVVEVYAQSYTQYDKQYNFGQWSAWSEWSTTPVTASENREVETITGYRYANATLGDHAFTDGYCAICGVYDPDNIGYHLVGYINGADYGCESDYATVGKYRFNEGKLVATFTEDSYVFIKKSDNSCWYMSVPYIEGTIATMVNTENGSAEKMFVPGNMEITFTLVENADGSLELSYEAEAPTTCTHSYTSKITLKPDCTQNGIRTYYCSKCKHIYSESIAALGHTNECKITEATCATYTTYELTCTVCGNVEVLKANELLYKGLDRIPDGMDAKLFTNEPIYRYRTRKTATSYEDTMEGYTLIGTTWVKVNDSTVYYVKSWPAGFDKTNALYTQYNNIENKVTDNLTETTKLEINSDKVVGYLYYHWCSATDTNHYSYDSKSETHNIFHAYYSTTAPSNYICDPSDMSYKTSHECCENGNSAWFFVTEVYGQNYTEYDLQYAFESWSDWSDWSTTEVTATSNREVESVTGYRFISAELEEHNYVNGLCTVCFGADPDNVGFHLVGHINGADYGCEGDYANPGIYRFNNGKLTVTFTEDSYVFIKTSDNVNWYMAKEYISGTSGVLYNTTTGSAEKMLIPGNVKVTLTLVENADGSLKLSYITAATCTHTYTSKVTTAATCTKAGIKTYTCSSCGYTYTEAIAATGHSYTSKVTAPTCTVAGFTTYTCSACGNKYTGNTVAATGHKYIEGTCIGCGAVDPDYNAPTTSGYYQVGNVSAITAGGKFVIVALVDGTYKALGTTVSSGKIAGVDVTVTDGKVTGATLPVWTLAAVEGGVSISVDGKFLSYTSSTNVALATNAYAWSVTAGESGFIFDSAATTRGIYYQISTGKFGAYAQSNATSTSYVSNLLVFKYVAGDGACEHSYTDKVTTAPTCTEEGVKTFTCSLCGDSYTETLAATGHTYENGKCVDCGISAEYYLVGYINGANYGCEEDHENLGEYKFVDGKLTVTFTEDSYVFVKTGDNAMWYLAESYCTDTTCVLVDGGAEKMLIPGNTKVTLTLVENDDGSLTLSYVYSSVTVTTPTLTTKNPTLAFEDEILYNVYYNVDNTVSIVEMGLVTFATRDENGTVANAQDIIPGYVKNADGTYTVHSNGIPAKMLGDALYFKVYAKLTDGSYVYSGIAGYHAVLYANTILNSSAASAQAKSLVVAMLNYGAAAQESFDYKTDSLMNAKLTAAQQALVDVYSDSMVAAVPSVSDTKAGGFKSNGGYTDAHPTVSFEGAFSINYYFTTKYTPDNGTVTFYYWNLNDFNANNVLAPYNASGSVKMTSDNNVFNAAIEGIAAKAIDEPVYIAALYTNGGTTYYTPVIGYSLGAYCKNLAANGNDFGAATAVYGYYAKAYFAS